MTTVVTQTLTYSRQRRRSAILVDGVHRVEVADGLSAETAHRMAVLLTVAGATITGPGRLRIDGHGFNFTVTTEE